MNRNLLGLLIGFGVGVLVAAVLVALFVPVTGKSLRVRLWENYQAARVSAQQAAEKRRAELEAELTHMRQAQPS
ncbi:MAG: hypothetical protein ACOYL5_16365 [Phototrophicaceae bacterium]|jgi:gas vesicle protein